LAALYTGSTGVELSAGVFRPGTDNAIGLGSASKRFSYVGAGDVAADQATCDSTTRDYIMVVNAAGGASDTLQVCMKAAADTYAWRTVYTAP
jgi:hypothetical protein